MTPTERAKRSDALYYETFSVTRRVLCDMIANREADLDDLREENASLREQVAEACKQLGGAWVRCTELCELARFIMHQCNDGNPRCDECIGWNDGECVALLRMRELGVDA